MPDVEDPLARYVDRHVDFSAGVREAESTADEYLRETGCCVRTLPGEAEIDSRRDDRRSAELSQDGIFVGPGATVHRLSAPTAEEGG